MTTTTKHSAPNIQGQAMDLAIARIVVGQNVRRVFDQAAIDEQAESIVDLGRAGTAAGPAIGR